MTAAPPDLALSYDATFSDRTTRAEDSIVQRTTRRYVDGRDVLDVGCGTGAALDLYEPRSYLGIDASGVMIQQAALRATLDPSVAFARVLAETCEPPAASFDTILCLWAYPYLEGQAALFAPWFRCLRPGGSVILVSWNAEYHPTWPVEARPVPMGLIQIAAEAQGFASRPLAGLRDRRTARRLARTLPLPLAARLIQTDAQHAPAFILRLLKPSRVTFAPRLPRPVAARPHPA